MAMAQNLYSAFRFMAITNGSSGYTSHFLYKEISNVTVNFIWTIFVS